MKFGLMSDLHLDFEGLNDDIFDWRGDVLILAGDTAEDDFRQKHLHDFYDKISKMAYLVVEVRGNHDSYNSEIDTSGSHLEVFLRDWKNIVSLDDSSLTHLPVDIWGSTFWTDFGKGNPIVMNTGERIMNDYRKIRYAKDDYRRLRSTDILSIHNTSKANLLNFLDNRENKNKPVVVVTHHAPTPLSIHPRYSDDKEMNLLYYSDQSDLILDHPEIKVWCHGHVHSQFDYMMGETRVLCNPRGYPFELQNHFQVFEFEV